MSFFFNSIYFLTPNLYEIFSFGIFIILISSFFFIGWMTTGYKILSPYNFGVGLFYFILIFFILNSFINLNLIIYIYIFGFSLFFLKKFKDINLIYNLNFLKNNQYLFSIIFILFFIFLSSKPHGWDTFSFWLPRLNYLLEYNTFPPSGFFRSEYPFSFELINFSVLHLLGIKVENIPALLDYSLILLMFFILIDELKSNKKSLITIIFVLFIFNPLIINTNSFSAYQDLKLSFIIFLIVAYIYKKKLFLVKNASLKEVFILSSFNSILCVTKNIGIVYFAIITLFFFSINFYYLQFKLFNFNNLRKIFIYFFISLSLFLLWNLNLYLKDIVSLIDFKGYRFEILDEFYSNFIQQILLRKIYFYSLLILMLLFLSTFYYKKFKHLRKNLFLILLIVFLWKFFLILFALSFQNYNHAINAHNYWRYFSHLGPIIFFGIFLCVIEYRNYLNKIKINLAICFLVFIILTVSLFDKMRRDLALPNYELMLVLKNLDYTFFDINKVIYLNSDNDRAYQKEIIRYYLKIKTGKVYLPKEIISGQKIIDSDDYQIDIFKKKVKFKLD